MKRQNMKIANPKSLRLTLSFLLLLAASAAIAQTPAQKSFVRLKSLAGSWEGKASQGHPVIVTFRNTAGESALMTEIEGKGQENMITMIHLDGPDRLMLTHYCGSGNQPRMVATASPDGKTITFDFLDATNLATTGPGHMQRVAFTILDANHHTEAWTFNAGPGKEMNEFFDLHRTEVAQK
ncbi:MAG: hypothetical protein WCF22_17730 [Candidatus Sulfotelmatobacter sp.]